MTQKSVEAPVLSNLRKRELLLLLDELKIQINNLSLLDTALTHSSYANEARLNIADYERLEFLGDSILGASVRDYLYKNLEGREGEYSRIAGFVVSEDNLSVIAHKLNIDKYIRLGKGEESIGGRENKAILADIMEAIFATLYLDQGFEAAKTFIQGLLVDSINSSFQHKTKDFKSTLQEHIQKKYKIVPTYNLISREGPSHDQIFTMSVTIKNDTYGPAKGKSKKEAEQNVAHMALIALRLIKD